MEGRNMFWNPLEVPRRRRRWSWLLLAFGAAACQAADDEASEDTLYGGEPPGEIGAPASDVPDTVFATVLEGTDSAATTVSGQVSVVAEAVDEPLELVVSGRGLAPGAHGWHVHEGSCESSRGVAIALSETADMEGITQPINAGANGEFEATVDVPQLSRTMVGRGEHSVHIHRNG